MKRSLAALSLAISLSCCSDGGTAPDNYINELAAENWMDANVIIENSVETAQAPPSPRHQYDFKDGDFYGYLGAISEEERKRGVATPSVVRFRYTGFWQGAHHLQSISDSGSVLTSHECAVPCVAIKQKDYNGQVRRIGYSSDSIIGAAFDDAKNGYLRRSPAPGAISGGYRFKGGNPGEPANWQPVSPPAASVEAESESAAAEDGTPENFVAANTF